MKEQISPDRVVGGAIAIYENIWADYQDSIEQIKSLVLENKQGISFEASTILDDVDNKINNEKLIRTSSNLFVSNHMHKNKFLSSFDKRCNEIIDSSIQRYREIFMINSEIFNQEGFQLLKYEPGGFYKAHHDSFPATKRAVSVLIYLNDDYEGGEIEFVNFDLKIKPKAGTLILFPSNYPYKHIAHPVTSGTKYVVVTWLHER